ncbi:MAG: triose-phosphate isomerase [Flavobacteriaceae bacterium]|nr:triose-phosphate isomerase [Flavobacteriaceae bacterium]
MRKKIVAGNWKMNNNKEETAQLIAALKAKGSFAGVEVKVAPTSIHLVQAVDALIDSAIEVIGQNMHQATNGAYTGEISASMLQSIGVNSVILGHSERRAYFNETDEALAEKVATAVKHDMEVVFCFGEELADRQNEQHFKVVEEQLSKALFSLPNTAWGKIVLAYEPVWAIGTGETASPEQAQEMHAFIRGLVAQQYDASVAENVAILYGGSVKPANAQEIFSKPDVDGGLIGGAALNADDFFAIVQSI